ncbi:alpha-ketoglutarate-dependent 2,4-dichlorophenoxyacetate dioxygenase [Alternaria panax]|uniref:Alpha-ketoglutarate-dependent 2,4-dichlorophenoxyacetate dioxygenase n=1 Tax=Alternaria panax TaxID=48097 RepID=A0AAD4I961_9PLEO|nr:alpha-ketoglutarate-dependent 2,4-dichlorophenoxyacetate dioxygenase [Alternaria panax]
MLGQIINGDVFRTIKVKQLHPTSGAEVIDADFTILSEEQFDEIKQAMAKYKVLVFRKANLSDKEHVEFSRKLGELHDFKLHVKEPRFGYFKIFDVGNIDENGKPHALDSPRTLFGRGNALRNKGSPEYFSDLDPGSQPMVRHQIVSTHAPSGRNTFCVGNYLHHIENADGTPLLEEENAALIEKLIRHVTRPKNVLRLEWHDNGDIIAWDNVSTLHRTTGGSCGGKFTRDMRRTTVKDDSAEAWGLNPTKVVLATDSLDLKTMSFHKK